MAGRLKATCLSNAAFLTGSGFRTDHNLTNITVSKTYKAVREGDWLRVWDDYGEDYLYPPNMFDVRDEADDS